VRGCFVSGTDTGVGKTLVATALIAALRHHGLDVGAFKPIETGVGPDGPADAILLRRAAGIDDPISDICPQHFSLPAAPTVAAEAEGRCVDLAAIDAAFARVTARHEFVVVEGAGGLLVPAAERTTMADLAGRFGLPLVIVARAALGTINHTLLTLEAAAVRGIPVLGVVISHADGKLSDADRMNVQALREGLGRRLIGEIPPLPSGVEPALGCVDVRGMLSAAPIQPA
jgi:dethiobiotin synthetase